MIIKGALFISSPSSQCLLRAFKNRFRSTDKVLMKQACPKLQSKSNETKWLIFKIY
ncbi:hypothetical protein Hdeb2414_s0007g00255821 [Helianthus debilis subsp. tardiflorus]